MPDCEPFVPNATVGSQGPDEAVGPVRSQTNVFAWFGFLGYVNVNEMALRQRRPVGRRRRDEGDHRLSRTCHCGCQRDGTNHRERRKRHEKGLSHAATP